MMKKIYSLLACFLICATLLQYRVANSGIKQAQPLSITVWDAFGYYLYIPSIYLYHDYKQLKWVDSIDRKYNHLSGGTNLPVEQAENGNYVNKYLGGIAILQIPLFFVGHWAAHYYGYPQDGYSPPYQYALGFGIIFYCLLATLILRKVLLYYFSDVTVAATLILVCLATNFIQYAAVDSGQSHAYLFLLYALILYLTIRWHQRPGAGWAALIGYTLGLAAICRPTEAIMLFIPLLWNAHTKDTAKAKWAAVKSHPGHVVLALIAGILGILPQLIYWKAVSGHWVYDVGSKWVFLNPWWRVLVGWEKGWFIYTPITLFFVAGLFFMKGMPFRKAVLTFCLLNIWIIISWDDWQYGGSYSTRALVQSYSVFALPLAAFIERIKKTRWKYVFYAAAVYLLGVNLFQITQYCSTVLHFREMNRRYYSRIYLNPNPSPIDMSLLDTAELLGNERDYQRHLLVEKNFLVPVKFLANEQFVLLEMPIDATTEKDQWLKIEATIIAPDRLWETELNASLQQDSFLKHTHIRLFNPVGERIHQYAFYFRMPASSGHRILKIYLSSTHDFEGLVKQLKVTSFD